MTAQELYAQIHAQTKMWEAEPRTRLRIEMQALAARICELAEERCPGIIAMSNRIDEMYEASKGPAV